MQEMTAQGWRRRGCSLIWSPELLSDLITSTEATPLSVVLEWQRSGPPNEPPGGARSVLVGGLQTVLEVMPDTDAAYSWLRANVLPLCRLWSNYWASVGLIFVMDGPSKLFNLNEADDLVYFGKSSDRDGRLCLTRAIWNGAASGSGAFKLVVEGSREVGGFHVVRVS
jgi:hypothetical protein